MLDQIASTVSNSAVLFAAAHLAGPAALESYAYAFSVYLIFLGINRALALDPHLTTPEASRSSESVSLVISMCSGVLAAAICVVIYSFTGRVEVLVVGCLMPVLLAQDSLRYVAFRQGLASRAFLIDTLWCLGILSIVTLPQRYMTGTFLVAVWAGAAGVSALFGLYFVGVRPWTRVVDVRAWLLSVSRYGLMLVFDSFLFTLGQQALLLWAVQQVSNTIDLAEIRAGQTLIGPLPALFAVLNMLVLPRLVSGPENARQILRAMRVISVLATVAWVTVLVFGRGYISQFAFDNAVSVVLSLLVILGGQIALQAYSLPLVASLRAQRRGKELLAARVISLALGAPVVSFYLIDPQAPNLALALAAQTLVYVVAARLIVRRLGVERSYA